MRLLDFRLDKFGPFTDHVLDLTEEGVHIIYGPNEAGKSSTLRAITHFLYGFPSRTSDDHVHLQRSLRVGAQVLEGDLNASQDNAVTLYRKKGNKNTLRDESDKAVDDATLVNMLHNLQRGQFENFFGLDNKTLDEGGEDLIKGHGNLGEALFSASMGGQQFQQLLKELDGRQGELFKNTGTNPKLNAAFKVLSEAEKQHKAHCLKSTEWEKYQRAVDDATQVLESVEALHKGAYLEKERLERINRTLPHLSSRTAIASTLAAIDEVRLLPDDSAETRLSAIKDINRCQPAIDELNDTLQSLNQTLEGLTINETVLAQDVAIEALKNEKALYQKNVTDYQLILGEVTERQSAIDTIVATILPADSLKQPAELILTAVIRQALGSLIDEGLDLETELASINAKRQENDEQIAEAEDRLTELPERVVIGELALAIKDAERTLTTAQEVDQRKQQVRDVEESVLNASCQLGLTAISENTLLALTVPSNQKISELGVDSDKLIEEKTRELGQFDQLNSEITALETKQKVASVSGQLITEKDLTTARQQRENLWIEIKDAWTAPSETSIVEVKENKANEYEISVGIADQHADRLRREADLLAEYGLMEIQLEKIKRDHSDQQKKLTVIDDNIESTAQAWQALWPAEVGSVGSHAEMSRWEAGFRALQKSITEKAKLNAEIDDKSPRITECVELLAKVLRQSGESGESVVDNKSLALLVDQANSVHTRLLQSKEERQSHETRKNDALKQKSKLSLAQDDANLRKEDWLLRWNDKIVVLDVPKESTVLTVKTQLTQFDQLAEALKEHRQVETKQNNLLSQITHFEESVTKLKADCGLVDKSQVKPLIKLHDLVEELKIAVDDKNRLQTLMVDIDRQQTTLQTETQRLKTAQEDLDGLLQLAGCETIEQLQLVETQNAERIDLRKELATIEKSLLSESITIDELYTESEGVNVDELSLMIEKVITGLDELDQRKKQAIEDRTTALSEFDAIQNQEGAVNAAEDIESALAQIDVHYREYCMLAITRQLLSEQIESYRQSNQGPVLSLAEGYFQRISLGRYSRLVTQYNDKDEPELYCLRGDTEVPIDGLSEGTRAQLFFSLRLASIMNYFDSHDPVPLIIDDIMMTFDDERSAVAFEVLGELAQKTQVLYFTHHSHHKGLAKSALKEKCVFHDLTPLAVVG